MEPAADRFDLKKMIEMSYTVADMPTNELIDIDVFVEYLRSYVLMLKTMGKLIEIGFADIVTKSKIIKENREKFNGKGENIESLEQLLELEIKLGLGKATGSNAKLGFGKSHEYHTHIGSCRSAERLLRFLFMLQRVIENLYHNKEDNLGTC